MFSAQTEYQRALLDVEKAIELSPGCVKGWIFKGTALHGLRDFGEFKSIYDDEVALQMWR